VILAVAVFATIAIQIPFKQWDSSDKIVLGS
jgi:hypothetical protein